MKRITLTRDYNLHKDVVFGKLSFSWMPSAKDIYTIELPWLDNKKSVSCIPRGVYKCTAYTSKKYKNVWQIQNVPAREAILIHSGNFASPVKLLGSVHAVDTEGCILVGRTQDIRVPMVGESKLALDYLREIIEGEDFELEIKSDGLAKNAR